MGLHHNPTAGIRPTGLLAITHLEVFTLFLFSSSLFIHHFLPFLCSSQPYKLNLLPSHSLVIPSRSPLTPFHPFISASPSASFHVCLNHHVLFYPSSLFLLFCQLHLRSHLSLPCVIFLAACPPTLSPWWGIPGPFACNCGYIVECQHMGDGAGSELRGAFVVSSFSSITLLTWLYYQR